MAWCVVVLAATPFILPAAGVYGLAKLYLVTYVPVDLVLAILAAQAVTLARSASRVRTSVEIVAALGPKNESPCLFHRERKQSHRGQLDRFHRARRCRDTRHFGLIPADRRQPVRSRFMLFPLDLGLRQAGVAAKTKGSRGFFRLRGSALSQALNGLRRWAGPIDVFRHVGRTRQILDNEIKRISCTRCASPTRASWHRKH